jgi:hypothetical protein
MPMSFTRYRCFRLWLTAIPSCTRCASRCGLVYHFTTNVSVCPDWDE